MPMYIRNRNRLRTGNGKIQMIKRITFLGLLIISIYGYGQSNYSAIDNKSKTVPDSLLTYTEIAGILTKNLSTDREKARALYIWISHNIRYDLSLINTNRRYNSSEEIINEVLTNKQGVCQHYSELFHAMSKSAGLKSYLISGYTRHGTGEIADISHAWNAIQIDSGYYLIDATWAAGYALNGKYIHQFRDQYFLIPPKDFIKDHMPFDPVWQFLDNPLDNGEFISNNFSKLDKKGEFAFRDSSWQYEQEDKLVQLEKSNRRIIACGVKNKLIQKQVDNNLLQITNLKYNLAIDTLNYGIDNYNLYVAHRNRKFRNPKLEDAQIKELMDNANHGVYTADKMLNELFSTHDELNNLIIDTRNRVPGMISNLEREKEFVNRYLKRWKPFRIFMFLTFG